LAILSNTIAQLTEISQQKARADKAEKEKTFLRVDNALPDSRKGYEYASKEGLRTED
jgi:hypothetical protein